MKTPLLDPALLQPGTPLSIRIAQQQGDDALDALRVIVSIVNDADVQEAPELYAELVDVYYGAARLCELARE